LLPDEKQNIRNFEDIKHFENYAISLCKKHLDKQYSAARSVWEQQYMEYADVTGEDENFIDCYDVLFADQDNTVIKDFQRLKSALEKAHKDGKFIKLRGLKYKMSELCVYDVSYSLYHPTAGCYQWVRYNS
jgi:hypothetical protein